QVCHRLWPTRLLGRLPDQHKDLVAACRAYERLIEVYYFGGEMPLSMYSAVSLLNLAEAAGALPGIAVGNSLLGAIFGFIPLRSIAEAYLHRALESVQKFDDIEARLLTLIGVGYYYAGVGNWERFRAAFDEVVRISMQFGHRRRLVDGFNSLMYLRLFKGEFPAAGQLADTLRESVKHLHDPRYRVFALAGETYSDMHAGKFDEALSLLEEAHHILTTHTEIGDKDQKIEVSGLLSVAHLRRAEFDQALELAQQAISLTGKSSPSAYHTFSGYAGPAEVYLTLWEAQYPLPSLANFAAKACKILNRFARIFPIGKPRFWLSQGRYYWLSGKPSQARKAWQKGLALATQLAMPYEQALAHYEIGRHLDKTDPDRQQHLGRAGEILTQCGENYYRVLVQELLASAKRQEESRS
ncbi:MAG: tetratricopeptide repeat protein, partial [Deltaproteobacteria bacterium]|nr:tetratricopeptide repeat protein [Deltaproteobacteria bacterium]